MKTMRDASMTSRKILIAGAGPAGSSLAIRLARDGHDVTLVEKESFPRHKLCGEFISPECLRHFRDLDVERSMITSGGDRITRTIFFPQDGEGVDVPSEWLGKGMGGALGLSRSRMDQLLIDKARSSGVEVIESATLRNINITDGWIRDVEVLRKDKAPISIKADQFVDATGRSRVFAHAVNRAAGVRSGKQKRRWVAFKAHFDGIQMDGGRCEIYFFRGGYGGLSYVEDGVANHCFLIRSDVVREFKGDPGKVFREVVLKNSRASETMADATKRFDWIGVSIDRFGTAQTSPAKNLFPVGDAAAFIDPFTGSGMLMALESAELLASYLPAVPQITENAVRGFLTEHRRRFYKRLAVCSVMRRLSFFPGFRRNCDCGFAIWRTLSKGDCESNASGKRKDPRLTNRWRGPSPARKYLKFGYSTAYILGNKHGEFERISVIWRKLLSRSPRMR